MRAPFNVERPVRRGAGDHSKDAFARVTGVQVVLIRQNGHVKKRTRQGLTASGERSLTADKVQGAIGVKVCP